MKTNKLLAAGALALSMAMTPVASLINAMPVAAEEVTPATTGTISVQQGDTHTYSVYQIFTGDLTKDGKLSNIKWGSNGKNGTSTVTTGADVPNSVIEELLGAGETNRAKLDIIEKYVNLSGTAYGTVSSTNPLTGVPVGYYLIKDSQAVTGEDASTLFITKVVGNVNIEPKKDVPTLEKKVQDTNDTTGVTSVWIDSADYDFGDQVPFQLTATLPSNYGEYSSYKLIFNDTYNATAFDYVSGSLKVMSGTNDITTAKGVHVNTDTDGTITVTIDDLKVADPAATSTTKIVVTYRATLEDTATLGITKDNENKANLQFSNNPNTDGSGELGTTPDDTVRVFTFKVDVTKTDNENKALNGAGFTLFKKVKNADGKTVETQIGQEIKPETGNVFEFKGLDDGDYVLKETTVPTGYTKAADINFTITATHSENSADPVLTEVIVDNKDFAVDASSGNISTTVVNSREGTLPETGGMGTTMIYGVGAVMVAGAAVFYVTNKRTRKD